MKKYRIRKNSPMDYILTILAVIGLMVGLSIPSTIEALL